MLDVVAAIDININPAECLRRITVHQSPHAVSKVHNLRNRLDRSDLVIRSLDTHQKHTVVKQLGECI